MTSQVRQCPQRSQPTYHYVEAATIPPLSTPLPSLFHPSNYSGGKQAELVYSEQQQGQLGGEEAQQGHNILYHPLSSINTTSLIYPASITSETGEGS